MFRSELRRQARQASVPAGLWVRQAQLVQALRLQTAQDMATVSRKLRRQALAPLRAVVLAIQLVQVWGKVLALASALASTDKFEKITKGAAFLPPFFVAFATGSSHWPHTSIDVSKT